MMMNDDYIILLLLLLFILLFYIIVVVVALFFRAYLNPRQSSMSVALRPHQRRYIRLSQKTINR